MTIVDGFVALVLLAGMLGNRQPFIPIAAIALVIVRASVSRIVKGAGFKRLEWAIVGCLGYWLVNYFWSTRDLNNLVSYDFLRHDGAFLVSYTTFIFLLGWTLSPRNCELFWLTFVAALALIAIPGILIGIHFPMPWFLQNLIDDLALTVPDQNVGERMYLGWYEGHNTVGIVYALASVITLTMVEQQVLGAKRKLFAWLLFLCCLGGLAFSYSRGNYIAFVAGALFVVPLRKFSRAAKVGLTMVVPAVLVVLLSSSAVGHIDTITDPYYGTNAARLDIWSDALQQFSNSPLVGIGFGRFNDESVVFKGVKHILWVGVSGRIVNNDGHAHNSYLQFLAEGGVVGLFVTMLVWWFAWAELSSFQHKLPKWKQAWLLKAAKGCVVVMLVEGLTEHVLGRGVGVLVSSALIGLTLAAARSVEATAKATEDRRQRLAAARVARREPVASLS